MAKFLIECPHCSTLNQASNFIFAKKVIKCGDCGTDIDVKANRLTSRKCPHCSNVFVYDQAKKRHTCPACHKEIGAGFGKIVSFPCPECSCIVQIDENQDSTHCPVCDKFIANVQMEVAKSKLVTDTGISVIKYEGDNSTFIWKHPIEDFNSGSQLIVHESQEAIFFMNGQALDTFGPGRWALETESLPVLKKFQTLPTGNQNPFHAEIYFINKTVQMSLHWGTADRIQFIEPHTGAPLSIGAHGEINLQVSDSRKLLVKLVGTTSGAAWENTKQSAMNLSKAFQPMIQTVIKANLASIIKSEKINILEFDENLELISERLRSKINTGFDEYGLIAPQFYIRGISLPEEKEFETIRKLYTEQLRIREQESIANITAAERKVEIEKQTTELEKARFEAEKMKITEGAKIDLKRYEGLADAEVMHAQGYDHKDEIQAEVQKAYAAGIGQMGGNGGSAGGGIMSDVLGLGISMATMGAMGEKVGDALKGFNNTSPAADPAKAGWKCSCGCDGNTGKFCTECGKAKPESWDCPSCGAKDNKGKFCSECGLPKPELWDCPHCGAKGNKGKFCSECGKTKETAETWDCECGNKGITGKFCSECGKRKGEN